MAEGRLRSVALPAFPLGRHRPVAIPPSFVGLPLPPGQYSFKAWVNNETDDDWQVSFTVRPEGARLRKAD